LADAGFKRKLAAILSADVQGYSRLMDDDEEVTVRTLTVYRTAINDLVQQYRGRVIDTPGDNILAEFTSVVDAVNCAVEIQRELAERNTELLEKRRMQFRIGVNLGDVIEEEGRIYGDGVNITARVEAMAEAGGICISGRAYDQVENKLGLEYEDLGEHQVKNITRPIRVFRVLSFPDAAAHRVVKAKKTLERKWQKIAFGIAAVLVGAIAIATIWNFYLRPSEVEVASVARMAHPLPDKPSIAVLPFENMSGDPAQDYFSDGLTDQIISTLSKLRGLFVISRSSVFTYKGKPVKVQKVAEDLGVKYVLEGSVQRTADRVRITAQLIDATTGHHIWSEGYDREAKDIFAIQDDITIKITSALRVELTEGEQARVWDKNTTTNLRAWEKFLQAIDYSYRYTKEDNATARRLYEEAIALDPKYDLAYAAIGWTYWFDARFGWVESRAESIKMALKYAQKAIQLNDTSDFAYLLIGGVYFLQGQYEKAIAEGERAIALNPNGAGNYAFLAGAVGCSGRWDESIELAKKAIRLEPFPPVIFYHWLGRAYFMTGQLDESIATWKKALQGAPDYLPAHAFLAACYSSLDRHAEASAAAKEVLRINPKFSIEYYAKTLPYKNKADIERYVAALRKAGLPE
jgi:adenylate cyclase